jgi:hypothetical protein
VGAVVDVTAPHVHVVAWDSATGPDHNGALVVTEHCTCGAVVGEYVDWIL